LNRVDETVLFHPLLASQVAKIVDLQVARIQKRLEDRQIAITVSEKAHAFIAEAAYDPHYGARPLKRYLQTHIETNLAKLIILGKIYDGRKVVVDADDNGLRFGQESAGGVLEWLTV